MQSGDKDDAFVYFKDTSELQKYFNAPYQEEYTPYRQILFVSSDLQGKQENPLEALRNSGVDLTEKIDLENPKYTLLFNQSAKGGVSINVKANGSTRFCKNKIRRKNDLEITWKKDYYQTVTQGGKWYEISSDFLIVDDNAQTVTVEEIELQPETKKIIFDVVSEKDGEKVTDAEIKVDSQPWQSLSNITFTAEELGREHKIAARKGEYLFSDVVRITPKNYSEATILLPLIEKRVVKITAADQENGDAIWPFKVRITGKELYKVTDQIEFVGDEIDKKWNIQIEKRREYLDSEKIIFCPATDGNEIIFKLKKEKKQPIGPFNPGDSYPNSPNKEKKQKSFAAKVKALFSKSAVIASMIVVVLIISLVIFDFYDNWDNQAQTTKTPLTAQQITAYVDGKSLSLDTLNEFKVNWEKQKPEIITHSIIEWYNPTTWFVGSIEAKSDSKDYKKWNKSSQIIEKAIDKRILINNKKFAELKDLPFSFDQQYFKTAIEKIDSANYEEVGQKLGDISAHTLTQIADSINVILTIIEQKKQATQAKQEQQEQPQVQKKGEKEPKQKKETVTQPAKGQSKTAYVASNLENDLQSAAITLQQLKDYSEANSSKFKGSIKLYNDFWKLVNSSTKKDEYNQLLKKVKEDSILKNSELKKFLDSICASSADFDKFKTTPGKATCNSLKELNKIIK
jgi:hypothetical protein